jgi:hypothetical protein
VTSPEHVTTGGVVSWTDAVNEHCAVFPEESVATHVTVFWPKFITDPEAGVQTTDCTFTLSVAAGGANVTTADVCPAEGETAMSDGQVMLGLMLSVTTTRNVQVDDRPALSIAVQETGVVVATLNLLPV